MNLSKSQKKELKICLILTFVLFAFGYVSEMEFETEADDFCKWAEENQATDTRQYNETCGSTHI